MATEYDPAKHETLVVKWYLSELRADPDELKRLFHTSLALSLTKILWWAAHEVKLAFEFDAQGIWAAAWLSPYMSGAEAGGWIRKDRRATIGAYRFIRHFYDAALQHFPVIVGITKQPELHDLHLALGYRYVGEIPALFDSVPAKIYAMTQESRREAPHGIFHRARRHDETPAHDVDPAESGEVRDDRHGGLAADLSEDVEREEFDERFGIRRERLHTDKKASRGVTASLHAQDDSRNNGTGRSPRRRRPKQPTRKPATSDQQPEPVEQAIE